MRNRSRTVLFALAMTLLAGAVISTMLHTARRIEAPTPIDADKGKPATTAALDLHRLPETPQAREETSTQQPRTAPEEEPMRVETIQAPEPVTWQRWVETPGFPARRMRQARPDNPHVFVPEDLYLENRMVLNQVVVSRDGERGMQITGRIHTDFIADKVPHGYNLPTGQLFGVMVRVELYAVDCVLQHSHHTGKPQKPLLRPTDSGTPVTGQSVSVSVNASEGDFGLAHFVLPPLEKPLPPGVYRLVATLPFQAQNAPIRDAIKWCSDIFGQRVEWEFSEGTHELQETTHEVMDNPELHEEVYRHMLQYVGEVRSEAVIYIGETLRDGRVGLATPGSQHSNVAVHDPYYVIAKQVHQYEVQFDNVDEVLEADLDEKLNIRDVSDAVKRKWREEAADDKRRILRDNGDLITKYGGRLSDDERAMLDRTDAALERVLQQIADFQDRLTYHYWVLIDGLMTYGGWHSLNVPGYNAWEAVNTNDISRSNLRREKELDVANRNGLERRWAHRHELWKYFPREIREVAFEYLRVKEETDTWDASKFTTGRTVAVQLDVEAWRTYVTNHLSQWLIDLQDRIAQVTTTERYALQTWPRIMSAALSAGEEVLSAALSWEFMIRTKEQMELDSAVVADWESVPPHRRWLYTPERIDAGRTPPGRLKLSFEQFCFDAKRELNLTQFSVRWRKAIDEGTPPPGLPD